MYAVRSGKKTGIFDTWDETKEYVNGVKGAEFKKVSSREEGLEYVSGVNIDSKYFYAVKQTGEIFRNWEDCRSVVEGKSGMQFKKFKTEEEAKNWIEGNTTHTGSQTLNLGIPQFYIDGCCTGDSISFGVVVLKNGKESCFKARTLGTMRNISGELAALCFSLHIMKEEGIKKAEVYYDFDGILKWLTGEWKVRSDEVKEYREFVNGFVKDNDISICYHKCKSHSGDIYNNKADKLAKGAITSGSIIVPLKSLLNERIDVSEVKTFD